MSTPPPTFDRLETLLARGAAQVSVRIIGAATAIAGARLSYKENIQERIVENINKASIQIIT